MPAFCWAATRPVADCTVVGRSAGTMKRPWSVVPPVFTTSLRHPMPPLAFQYLANAFRASTLPWNRPGASGDPTSAITVTLMSVAVTPTSVSFSASDLHLSVAPAAVVLVPDALLLLFDLSLRPHETAIMP